MYRWIHIMLGLALAAGPGTAVADSLVTAEWNLDVPGTAFGSFGGTGFSQARGQTFTATVDGRVETIELRIARNSDHSEPIVIELFEVDAAGKPAGDALMSGEFPAASMPVDVISSPTVFTFANGSMVAAGERYAITCAPLTLDPGGNNYHVNGGVGDNATYAEGSALRSADAGASWIVETTSDWGFRVVVDETTPVENTSWSAVKRLFL
jgi:hypothetical protein